MHLRHYFKYLVLGGGALGTVAALMPPSESVQPAKAPVETTDAKTDFKQATAPITIERIDEMLALLKTPQAHEHPAIKVAADPTKNFNLKNGDKNSILDKITFVNQSINLGGDRTDIFSTDVSNRIAAFQKAMHIDVTGQINPETFKAYMQADNIIKARIGLIAKKTELQGHGSMRNGLHLTGKESSFNPNAKAKKSSGEGLSQMINLTWEEQFMKHGHKFGQKDIVDALKKNPDDPHARAQMQAARTNPDIAMPLAMIYFKKNKDYAGYVLGDKDSQNLKTMASTSTPKTADRAEYIAAHKKDKNSPLVYDNPSERLGKKSKDLKDPVRSVAKANRNIFFETYDKETKEWKDPRTSEQVLKFLKDEFMKVEQEVKAVDMLVNNLLTNPSSFTIALKDGRTAIATTQTSSLAGKTTGNRL